MRAIKPKISVVAAAACCLIAVSCVSNGPPSANGNTNHAVAGPAKKGGTLVVGINDDVDSLDSALASEEVSQDVMAPMCQGLYYRGASGQPEPQLATSLPQLSDGGKTATITLRSGVAFNDGTTFNAAAVKQSWELGAKLAGSTFVSTLAFIKAIDTPNPRTLVLHLYHPYAPLATELTYMLVASPTQRLKLGAKFATDPVCVGPFKFVSRVPGVSITEAKSSLYYDKTKVNLDDIDFKVITDADAGEAALRTGSIDLYTGVPLTDVAAMQKAQGVRVIYQVGAGWYALAINIANKSGAGKPTAYQQLDTPLAKSAQLRQALALSIDRNVLSQLSSDGLSYPGCSPLAPSSLYFDNPHCPPFDLAKAKQLVKASGYPTPIKFDMTMYTSPANTVLAQAMQAMVAKAGFEMTITTYDLSTWITNFESGHYDTTLFQSLGEPDPSGNVDYQFLSNGYQDITGLKSNEVDALLTQALSVTATSARTALYKQALQLIRDSYQWIFLFNPAVNLAARTNIVGYSLNPFGNVNLSYAGFKS